MVIHTRDGYRWTPDNGVQTGNGYRRQPGCRVRDNSHAVKEKKPKKHPHDKHPGGHPGKGMATASTEGYGPRT